MLLKMIEGRGFCPTVVVSQALDRGYDEVVQSFGDEREGMV